MKDLFTKLTNRSKRRLMLHQGKRARLDTAVGIFASSDRTRRWKCLVRRRAWAREGAQRVH